MVELEQLNGTPIAYYSFDGNGLRVIKVQVTGSQRTYYLYDGTNVIAEFYDTSTTNYNSGTTPQQAPADSVSLLLYQLSDHLTTRMTTDNFAANSSSEGHFPYGDPWYDTGMADPSVVRKFTSYNRDSEAASGFLNYAVFRQHSSRLGRFQMADPVVETKGSPQGFNRYAYAAGDPTYNVDPTGQFRALVEIPADWPCLSTEVVCGCDPFVMAICTVGLGYPPSDSGGGGGSPIKPVPEECQLLFSGPQPEIHVCRGMNWTAKMVITGKGLVTGFGQVEKVNVWAEGDGNLTRTTGPATQPVKGLYSYEVSFAFKRTGLRGETARILWHISYNCKGDTYMATPTIPIFCKIRSCASRKVNMLDFTFLGLSLLLNLAPQGNNRQIPTLCAPNRSLSIESPAETDAIELKRPFFYSSAASESFAEVELTNHFNKPIGIITIVMDFIAPNDTRLVTIAFELLAGSRATSTKWMIHTDYLNKIPDLIQTSQHIELIGISPVATATCPTKARVTFVEIQFADGTAFRWARSKWSFPPTVLDAPYFSDEPPLTGGEQPCSQVKLMIDDSGKLQSIQSITDLDKMTARYALEQFSRWSFRPSLSNGHPVPSELLTLLCFEKKPQFHFATESEVPVPLTLIEFFPSKRIAGRWEAYVGTRPASNRLTFDENSDHN